MKGWKVFWGLAFIAIAVFLILEALGVIAPITSMVGEITFWQAVGGVGLLCAIVSLLCAGQVWEIFVLLGFLFMIFEKNIAYVCGIEGGDIINNWLVFGCSLLLSAGFMFLIPTRKKKRKNRGAVVINVKDNEMGAAEVYIDCEEFGNTDMERSVSNKLGALEVHFENADKYKGGATLHIDNKLGATEIYVPKNWKVKYGDVNVSLGSLDVEAGEWGDDDPMLILKGEVRLGSVEVERV